MDATIEWPDFGAWYTYQEGSTFAVIGNIRSDTDTTYDTFGITPGAEPYVDPCATGSAPETVEVGPSVDDLVNAMLQIPVNVSPVTETTVAGYPAKQLTFTAPEPRPGCENGQFQLWRWPAPFSQPAPVGPVGSTTAYVVDVAGTRVMVTIEDRGTAEDSAHLQRMLEALTLASKAPLTPSPAATQQAGPKWVRWELNPPGFFVHAALDALDFNSPGNWGTTQIGSTLAVIYNDTGATYDTLNITTGAAPYVDPCAAAPDRRLVEVGPSVDDLIQALSNINVNVTTPTYDRVGGFSATQLTFTAPEPRPGCENGEYQLWQWPDPFAESSPLGPIGQTTVYVVDVGGTRVMVTIEDRGTAADRALMQHMLDSLQLAPKPESAVTPDPSAYVIRGRITMSDGVPVGYAQVEASCEGCNHATTWTNADGTYEIVLDKSVKELGSPMASLLCYPVAGYFDNAFWFGPSGWSWSTGGSHESFQVGPLPTVVDVTLPATVEVSGKVVTEQNQPLSGIEVWFGNGDVLNNRLNRTVHTDNDGRFHFHMLPGSGSPIAIDASAQRTVGFGAVVTVGQEPITDLVITRYARP